MKNKKVCIFLCAFFLTLGSMLFNNVEAKADDKIHIKNINMKVNLMKNGDAQIEEYITMNFKGTFNGAFVDIATKDTGGVEDFRVYLYEDGKEEEFSYDENAKKKDYGVYNVEEEKKNLYRVKMFIPTKSKERTFKVMYTLKDCAVLYDDVGELYFNFWDKGYETEVESFQGTIVLPSESNYIKNYVRGGEDYLTQVKDNKIITFSGNNVKSNKYFTGRVIFDKGILNNPKKVKDFPGKDKIVNEEEKYILDAANKKERNQVITKILSQVFYGVLAVNILLVIIFIKKNKRKKSSEMKYPNLCSPALVKRLCDSTVDGMSMVATIIDLSQKGHIELSKDPFKEDNYIIKLLNNGEPTLKSHEAYFLRWFGDMANEDDEISTDDIEKIMKKSSEKFAEKHLKWVEKVNSDYRELGFKDKSCYTIGTLMIIVSIVELVYSIVLTIGNVPLGIIAILQSVTIMILGIVCFVRLNHQGYMEKNQWKQLKDKFQQKKFEEINSICPIEKCIPYFIALGVYNKSLQSFRNFAMTSDEFKDNIWLNEYFAFDTFVKGNSFMYFANSSFSNTVSGGISTGGGGGVGGGGAGGF